jgi:cytosine/adenosine deaminase-related metal-dependent hydrolase
LQISFYHVAEHRSIIKIYTAHWVLPVATAPLPGGAVAVSGDRIVGVGPANELHSKYPDATVEDFGESAIVPGLVNCHTHLELTVMRGYLEDVEHDFFSWLRKLTIARMTQMSADDLYDSALWGVAEAARAGITCVGDASSAGISSLAAVLDGGLRGNIYQEVFGPDAANAKEAFEGLREKVCELRERETQIVKAAVSPHAPYTVSRPLLELVSDYAISERLPLMIHAAESEAEKLFLRQGTGPFADGLFKRSIDWAAPGVSTIEYLKMAGVLNTAPLLAHCIRVSSADISMIHESKSGVAHCPKSNAKLGHGRAPIAALRQAGVNLGFGSDSVASNNSSDMLEEARFATLLSRLGSENTPAAGIRGEDALFAATLGGARAMGLGDVTGSIEAGKQADLAVISLAGVHQRPVYDAVNTLIFSSSGRDVLSTIVAGREIYRDGICPLIDIERLGHRMNEIRSRLFAL